MGNESQLTLLAPGSMTQCKLGCRFHLPTHCPGIPAPSSKGQPATGPGMAPTDFQVWEGSYPKVVPTRGRTSMGLDGPPEPLGLPEVVTALHELRSMTSCPLVSVSGTPRSIHDTLATARPDKVQGRQKQVLAVLLIYAEGLPIALSQLNACFLHTSSDRRYRNSASQGFSAQQTKFSKGRTSTMNSYAKLQWKPAKGLLKELHRPTIGPGDSVSE